MKRHYDVHNSPRHYDEYGVKGSTYEHVPRHRAQCVDTRLRMRVRECMHGSRLHRVTSMKSLGLTIVHGLRRMPLEMRIAHDHHISDFELFKRKGIYSRCGLVLASC